MVPVVPCCDLLKVCEVVTVCILSQFTAYSISAVFAAIPLWSANLLVSLLEVFVTVLAEPTVMSVSLVTVTLNCPELGVPVVAVNAVLPLNTRMSVPEPV